MNGDVTCPLCGGQMACLPRELLSSTSGTAYILEDGHAAILKHPGIAVYHERWRCQSCGAELLKDVLEGK